MLITDQKKLLRLALVFRIDIDFLVESIKSDPAKIDGTARSQFVEAVVDFLKGAFSLTEKAQSHLLSSGVCQQTTTDAELPRPAGNNLIRMFPHSMLVLAFKPHLLPEITQEFLIQI